MSDVNRSARDEALRYLEREVEGGRGRVLLPRSMATSPEQPAVSVPSPVPSASATPPKGDVMAKAPATPKPKNPDNQPLPPFTAFRSAGEVKAIHDALAAPSVTASTCTACVLSETRNTVVFGTGSGRSGIVIIGEAPGAKEDEQGEPFVGRSGQLLDRILVAIGVERGDVYICNVLKCRPPSNRDPKPEEAAACAGFLQAQLDALQPRVLCALGLHATRWLLPDKAKAQMATLRGEVHDYRGIPTIATYHPAALLRNPNLKPKAWEDFKLLRSVAER